MSTYVHNKIQTHTHTLTCRKQHENKWNNQPIQKPQANRSNELWVDFRINVSVFVNNDKKHQLYKFKLPSERIIILQQKSSVSFYVSFQAYEIFTFESMLTKTDNYLWRRAPEIFTAFNHTTWSAVAAVINHTANLWKFKPNSKTKVIVFVFAVNLLSKLLTETTEITSNEIQHNDILKQNNNNKALGNWKWMKKIIHYRKEKVNKNICQKV